MRVCRCCCVCQRLGWGVQCPAESMAASLSGNEFAIMAASFILYWFCAFSLETQRSDCQSGQVGNIPSLQRRKRSGRGGAVGHLDAIACSPQMHYDLYFCSEEEVDSLMLSTPQLEQNSLKKYLREAGSWIMTCKRNWLSTSLAIQSRNLWDWNLFFLYSCTWAFVRQFHPYIQCLEDSQ